MENKIMLIGVTIGSLLIFPVQGWWARKYMFPINEYTNYMFPFHSWIGFSGMFIFASSMIYFSICLYKK